MKVAALSLFALAGFAAAQESCLNLAITAVPGCAQTCLQSAAQKVGCAFTDFGCQCKTDNSAKISTAAAKCIIQGCGAQTAAMVAPGASAVCKCAGAAGGGSASTPASGSATPTGGSSGSSSTPSSGGSGGGSSESSTSKESIQTGAGPTPSVAALGGLAAGIFGLAAFL